MSSQRSEDVQTQRRGWAHRRMWLGLGAVICLLSWGVCIGGLVVGAGRDTLLILITVAAAATEGLFWLIAAMLGVSVFEARRALWRRLRGGAA